MARIKYKRNLEAEAADFEGGYELVVKGSGKEARWVNTETGAQIIVEGKNLSAHEDNPELLVGGRITSATVLDADGKTMLDITGLNMRSSYVTVGLEMGGYLGAINQLADGDDKVTGTNKDDFIFSGPGDDTMTGKGGSDVFRFQAPLAGIVEHDTITDFDTKGADADRLEPIRALDGYKGTNGGKDTLLEFVEGSTLLLEDVTRAEFKQYWDSLPD